MTSIRIRKREHAKLPNYDLWFLTQKSITQCMEIKDFQHAENL
jgi:hypothetical protein